MITIFLHRDGRTEPVTSIDRAWLNPASGVFLWVDLAAPSIPDSLILSDTFAFHPLSVEDAMALQNLLLMAHELGLGASGMTGLAAFPDAVLDSL